MDIGFTKILLFGMIALMVLGPEKLPQAVRTAGRYYAKFRRTVTTIQQEIEAELNLAETRQMMQSELAKLKQTENDIKLEMEKLRSSVSQLQQNHSHDNHTDTTPSVMASDSSVLPPQQPPAITQPMYYRWFLLSDYDRARRLPNVPFLPNYHADKLIG